MVICIHWRQKGSCSGLRNFGGLGPNATELVLIKGSLYLTRYNRFWGPAKKSAPGSVKFFAGAVCRSASVRNRDVLFMNELVQLNFSLK